MQRATERRGIPTVSVSVALDVSQAITPPRVLYAPFMMGHVFGPVGHAELQRRMIRQALALCETATESPNFDLFPISWAEARRQAKSLI